MNKGNRAVQVFFVATILFCAFAQAEIAYRGVNLSCAEFAGDKLPGEFNRHYTYPTEAEIDYYSGKGMNLFRLCFQWERIQPKAGEEFKADEFARLDKVVTWATAKDCFTILDPHNYARYYGKTIGADAPEGCFADLWKRLAEKYKDNPKVIFGLINEPHDMPTELWLAQANEAIAAIRQTGAGNLILVPGNGWTGAWTWQKDWYGTPNAKVMLNVKDSANNFAYEVHQYLDEDGSGRSPDCVSKTIGSERLKEFTEWLRANNKRALLGEFGVAANETALAALDDITLYLESNSDTWIGWSYWAAGPWWGDYMYSIEPAGGEDKPQMNVLEKYLKAPEQTFRNPLLKSGADPWVFYKDGNYHYIKSQAGSLVLMRTPDITRLSDAERKVIWRAKENTDHAHALWAPEIQYIRGAWYVYVAADDGNHLNHRLHVLENRNEDPFEGEFEYKAKLKTDAKDNWAIDGSVFEHKGQLYIVWSGWREPKVTVETQRIYIAKMSNPWTVDGERVEINEPTFDWERIWEYEGIKNPEYAVYVNEGPQMLSHGDKIHIIYSCSGCWTPYYALGMLTAHVDSDLMNPDSWMKADKPVFRQSPENGVYGTGHNCFFKSPDGTEDWLLYHANDNPTDGCGSKRSPRAQPFTWTKDDYPVFGEALPTSQELPKPSGTPR
ncbi:MAG: cellulase family glycosylhydrolase [Phycisphaerae bacterium]|jgi:GH43 family beta-xylosidase/aryl-phospho-beta-D-glucosidase BglC (GH1 family)